MTSTTRTITVSGTLRNVGNRKINDVELRLQLGVRLVTEAEISSAIDNPPDEVESYTPFARVAHQMQPGDAVPISLRASIGPDSSLDVTQPGVYPLLVNVNGTPDYGGRARLASLNVLLPVRSAPGSKAPQRPPTAPDSVTMLWPIADVRPRVVGVAGNGQPELSDDDLGNSLSAGGRLYELLDTASQANPAVLGSMCFAVDPDLLDTVTKMAAGYLVRRSDGSFGAGTDAYAAKAWLSKLRDVTKGQCVIALPFASADLVGLSRAGVVDLEKLATNADVVTDTLKSAKVQPHVVWPIDGLLDQRTLGDLVSDGGTSTVLASSAVLSGGYAADAIPLAGSPSTQPGGTSSAAPHAVRIDALLSTALHPSAGGSGAFLNAPDDDAVAVQDGLATLLYRTQFGHGGRRLLVAPPQQWTASSGELSTLLHTVQGLYADHTAKPAALPDLISAGPVDATGTLSYTQDMAKAETPGQVTGEIAADDSKCRDLLGAMSRDDAYRVAPSDVITPVQQGMLRATSGAYRGQSNAASTAVHQVT
ncbi:MAG: hypothetical protein J2O49_04940, partial [Sciscionella sp.]|nr:hypothetical protein [Sciscionella sp.]